MNFNKGDIIEYYNQYYEVIANHGETGEVACLDLNFQRTGEVHMNFYWEYYKEKSRLIKSHNQSWASLINQSESLIKTLKFYENESNYQRDSEGESNVDVDNGHRAREVMKLFNLLQN